MKDSNDEEILESVQPVIKVPVVMKKVEQDEENATKTATCVEYTPVEESEGLFGTPVIIDNQLKQSVITMATDEPSQLAISTLSAVDSLGQRQESGLYVVASMKQSPTNVVSVKGPQTVCTIPEQGQIDLSGASDALPVIDNSVACAEPAETVLVPEQIETVNEKGEKVLVQHYLLTSITTNTSSGKQTNQLITTPIVIPPKTEASGDSLGSVPIQLLLNTGTKGSEMPVQSVADGAEMFLDSAQQPAELAAEEGNTSDINVEALETLCEISPDDSVGVQYIETGANFVNDPSKDKINITFVQRETEDDEDSLQMSSNRRLEFVPGMGSIMDTNVQMIPCSSTTAMEPQMDPHCADNCSDYTGMVDGNKEYMLSNPVVDDLGFQEDIDRMPPTSPTEITQEVLSMAASTELSDTLSSI